MYISWKPDPKALAIGAFSIKWNTEFYYIFPPFSLLGKVAAKTYRDKIKAIVVIPKWSAQHWYPKLLRKATKSMTITPSSKNPQTPGSTKSSPTTPKALPTSTPDRLTTQDIISASLRSQHARNICVIRHAGKNIVLRKTSFMIVLQLSNF